MNNKTITRETIKQTVENFFAEHEEKELNVIVSLDSNNRKAICNFHIDAQEREITEDSTKTELIISNYASSLVSLVPDDVTIRYEEVRRCETDVATGETEDDILDAYMKFEKTNLDKIFVVSQTTFSSQKFDDLADEIQTNFCEADVMIDKTICNSTENRQLEATKMARNVDVMLIIGGKNSSNTRKLFEISSKHCPKTYAIETVEDMTDIAFEPSDKIGIMAGASTPKQVIEEVKSYLEKQGINVIMTREGDEFVTLQDRCKKANWVMADLFVSIHRNSAEGGDGVEVWISNGEDEESSKLASSILQKIDQVGMQTNRGVKTGTSENSEADYFVNKNTKMPSCLIELGFISNKKDNELWDKNVEQYAEGIAEGIMQNLEK